MNALIVFLLMVCSNKSTDSIVGVYGEGRYSHKIVAKYGDGTERVLVRDNGGGLWLGDVSYDHNWFEMFNRGWGKAKRKDYGVLVCNVKSMMCVRTEDFCDSAYYFDQFLEDAPVFVLCSTERINGKFVKRKIPLDSFQILFNSKSHRFVKP